jgi:hypothetical protein
VTSCQRNKDTPGESAGTRRMKLLLQKIQSLLSVDGHYVVRNRATYISDLIHGSSKTPVLMLVNETGRLTLLNAAKFGWLQEPSEQRRACGISSSTRVLAASLGQDGLPNSGRNDRKKLGTGVSGASAGGRRASADLFKPVSQRDSPRTPVCSVRDRLDQESWSYPFASSGGMVRDWSA